jgi:hypothetical protein
MSPRWGFGSYWIVVLQRCRAYGAQECALDLNACKVQPTPERISPLSVLLS